MCVFVGAYYVCVFMCVHIYTLRDQRRMSSVLCYHSLLYSLEMGATH